MSFPCISVDTNNNRINILNELAHQVGSTVVGTTVDFKDWFRKFGISKDDLWKALIMTIDGVRIDRRLQMGRKSSAIHGQRLSYLVGEVIEHTAEKKGWRLHRLDNKQCRILNN